MYFIEKCEGKDQIKYIDSDLHPDVDLTKLEDDLQNGKLVKLSYYFSLIFMPHHLDKSIIIDIDKPYKYNVLYHKITLFLKDLIEHKIPFWYKKTKWYMLIDSKKEIINVSFISSFSNDIFEIEIIKKNDLDQSNTELNNYYLSIKIISGFINNFIHFVNEIDKVFNEERYNREGDLLEKQSDEKENYLWRFFWTIPFEQKFNIAIIYMILLDPIDKLFSSFVFTLLLQCKFDYIIEKLLLNPNLIKIVFNLSKIPFYDKLTTMLIEKSLFMINILCENNFIYDVLMNDLDTVKFMQKLCNDDNIPKELIVMKNECMKLMRVKNISSIHLVKNN